MSIDNNHPYDVVIVGSGVAGALIAKRLGRSGRKVLILEAGAKVPPNINGFMNRFYNASAKVPESPYPPELGDDPNMMNAGRPTSLMLGIATGAAQKDSYLIQNGPLKFGSTYERAGGGTALHWLGTSLRLLPNDFHMSSYNSDLFVDWPIDYNELNSWYGEAESELGVSANSNEQGYLHVTFPNNYSYPMPGIPLSTVDEAVAAALAQIQPVDLKFLGLDDAGGKPLQVVGTPAARNSQPYQNRRVCAGNTNCIPICPIQAKYDPTVTLNDALESPGVDIAYRTVAKEIVLADKPGSDGRLNVARIDYLQYAKDAGPVTGRGSVSAKIYIIAGNSIETPRLLLMSTAGGRLPDGVANSSKQVGRNLMDHPYYVAWALTDKPVYPYRGPLSTAGIEDQVRDGAFRRERGAFRVEIGNEGWNFVVGGGDKGSDPALTTLDLINGTNYSRINKEHLRFSGAALVDKINFFVTRQVRLGFLIEQTPEARNRVTLSNTFKDGLGLPRPCVDYDLSDYTKKGIFAAKQTADLIFKKMGATQFTEQPRSGDQMSFEWPVDGKITRLKYDGAGHLMGTFRMGKDPKKSVVDADQRSHDHPNLFLVGSGVFPTTATANPTLTLAALCLRTASVIDNALSRSA